MKIDNFKRAIFMLGTGLLMGGLFSFQSKSVSQANIYYNRENRVNIFKEIQIIKDSNKNLSDQVTELEKELASSNDKEQALNNIKKEIERYQIVAGQQAVNGSGISITVSGELESLWFTDMINELFSAGAEVISVNEMRIADSRNGFDTMPNGQILLGGEILSPPFQFQAIGDKKTLVNSISQVGGIISRINAYKPDYKVEITEENNLQIKPISLP